MKRILLIGLLVFLPQAAFAGSQTFTSSGTFTIPSYGTLTVEVWGGGGGGGAVAPVGWVNPQSTPGGKSAFSSVEAGGGGSGISEYVTGQLPGATTAQGGVASGGDINLSGGISPSSPYYPGYYSSAGGSAPYGGAGGAGGDPDYWCPAHIPGVLDVNGRPGVFPGGGGGGAEPVFGGVGGGAGAGAYAKKTYAQSELAAGTIVPVTIGAGGTGGHHGTTGWCIGNWGYWYWDGGAGAPGQVIVTWTDPPPALSCNGTAETFSTPGTYTRTVPTYSTMSVTVNGAGGGGGGGSPGDFNGANGSVGGVSSFNVSVTGNGGGGGSGGAVPGGKAGASGTASGGDTNTTGGGASGGTGGVGSFRTGYPGGAGGKSLKIYTSGALPTGSAVTIVVGTGGVGGYRLPAGGDGGSGSVTITCSQNSPPTTPAIAGPTSGFTKTNYTYTFRSTDPDSDTLRYAVDWDNNGSIDEYVPALGYVSSGTTGSTAHSWNSSNTQTFKVLAQDSLGNTSGWASYTINMSPNAPTVLLTAAPSSITNGQSSTLTWSSTNANSCTGTNFGAGGATSGSTSVSPTITTTYTVTCTGAGGTASDSKTVTYIPPTCTPSTTYTCTGAGNNTIRRMDVSAQCVTTVTDLSPSCQSPQFCSAGSPTCIDPTPQFGPSGHLRVTPTFVRIGAIATVSWDVSNVQSCTVVGDNKDGTGENATGVWNTKSGAKTTSGITTKTTYTLDCLKLDGTHITEGATVNIVPVFQEL